MAMLPRAGFSVGEAACFCWALMVPLKCFLVSATELFRGRSQQIGLE
jgi:hypothetical protein